MTSFLATNKRVLLTLALLCLAGFGPTLWAHFQEDDFDLISRVQADGPFGVWSFGETNFFRPIISLSLWIQFHLHGENPFAFRLFNVAFHIGVSYLLFLVLDNLFRPSAHGRTIAAVSASIFAIHPSRAEPVEWIASRTDLCASFFGLLCLYAFIRFTQTQEKLWIAASLTSFFVGVLCKESVVIAPLLCGVYALILKPSRLAGQTATKVAFAFFAIGLLYLSLRYALIGTELQGNLKRSLGPKLIGTTIVQIVRILLPGLPFGDPHLNNTQSLRTIPGIVALGFGCLILLTLLAKTPLKKEGDALTMARRFLLAATVISLLPSVGLAVRLFRSQGERFVYLAAAFLIPLLISLFLVESRGRLNNLRLSLGIGLICLALLQWQNVHWNNGGQLAERFERAVAMDIVPNVPETAQRVLLLNAPSRVQGSYGALYVFPVIARKHGLSEDIDTETLSSLGVNTLEHTVHARRNGNIVTLLLPSDQGRFIAEDTFEETNPTRETLAEKGVVVLEPQRVVFDLDRLPEQSAVFAWTGKGFVPIFLKDQGVLNTNTASLTNHGSAIDP